MDVDPHTRAPTSRLAAVTRLKTSVARRRRKQEKANQEAAEPCGDGGAALVPCSNEATPEDVPRPCTYTPRWPEGSIFVHAPLGRLFEQACAQGMPEALSARFVVSSIALLQRYQEGGFAWRFLVQFRDLQTGAQQWNWELWWRLTWLPSFAERLQEANLDMTKLSTLAAYSPVYSAGCKRLFPIMSLPMLQARVELDMATY